MLLFVLPTVANRGKPWQTVANHGKPWQTVANRGKPWQTAANRGKPREFDFYGVLSMIAALEMSCIGLETIGFNIGEVVSLFICHSNRDLMQTQPCCQTVTIPSLRASIHLLCW